MNFFITGTPKPQGRPRHISMGKFVKVYSPVTEWRETVVYHCAKQVEQGFKFENKALIVELTFFFKRPKSHFKTGKNIELLKDSAPQHHISKPDCDNLAKAVFDAMVTSGLIDDDSRIVFELTRKVYSQQEGVYISICEAN